MKAVRYGIGLLGALLTTAILWTALPAQAQPQFQVDPFWPKPLPRDPVSHKPWVTGEVAGTCLDSQDHLFTVNRASQGNLIAPEDVIAVAAPPVIEYDTDGNVVHSFGEPDVVPTGLHGCFVDFQDNFWLGGNGDGVVQKYSHDGHLLMQIGEHGVCDGPCGSPGNNRSHRHLNEPADIAIDPTPGPGQGDIYIADGYGNHRVVVFNQKGEYLRQWGNAGTDPGYFQPNGGGHPHCVVIGPDNLLYACDRGNDRIQVFEKDPTACSGDPPDRICLPLRVIPVVPGTFGLPTAGSAWDLDFSRVDTTVFFEADGGNEILHVFDWAMGQIIGGFGRPGHQAGDFTFLHSVAVDSQGNLYTGETIGGRRVQKFVRTGGGKAR